MAGDRTASSRLKSQTGHGTSSSVPLLLSRLRGSSGAPASATSSTTAAAVGLSTASEWSTRLPGGVDGLATDTSGTPRTVDPSSSSFTHQSVASGPTPPNHYKRHSTPSILSTSTTTAISKANSCLTSAGGTTSLGGPSSKAVDYIKRLPIVRSSADYRALLAQVDISNKFGPDIADRDFESLRQSVCAPNGALNYPPTTTPSELATPSPSVSCAALVGGALGSPGCSVSNHLPSAGWRAKTIPVPQTTPDDFSALKSTTLKTDMPSVTHANLAVPSHHIHQIVYREYVSGIKLSDGTEVHYDLSYEDLVFLHNLNYKFSGIDDGSQYPFSECLADHSGLPCVCDATCALEAFDRDPRVSVVLTQEEFLMLIDGWEKLATRSASRSVSFEHAAQLARDVLGLQRIDAVVLKTAYEYWVSRLKALGQPLLRQFWPSAAAQASSSPQAVLRIRQKEKMILRRPRRNFNDSQKKMQRLLEDFRGVERLLSKAIQRDQKRLQLAELNTIIFDQQRHEILDPTYRNPAWECYRQPNSFSSYDTAAADTAIVSPHLRVHRQSVDEVEMRKPERPSMKDEGVGYAIPPSTDIFQGGEGVSLVESLDREMKDVLDFFAKTEEVLHGPSNTNTSFAVIGGRTDVKKRLPSRHRLGYTASRHYSPPVAPSATDVPSPLTSDVPEPSRDWNVGCSPFRKFGQPTACTHDNWRRHPACFNEPTSSYQDCTNSLPPASEPPTTKAAQWVPYDKRSTATQPPDLSFVPTSFRMQWRRGRAGRLWLDRRLVFAPSSNETTTSYPDDEAIRSDTVATERRTSPNLGGSVSPLRSLQICSGSKSSQSSNSYTPRIHIERCVVPECPDILKLHRYKERQAAFLDFLELLQLPGAEGALTRTLSSKSTFSKAGQIEAPETSQVHLNFASNQNLRASYRAMKRDFFPYEPEKREAKVPRRL